MTTKQKQKKLAEFWSLFRDKRIWSGAVVNLSYDKLWSGIKEEIEQIYDGVIQMEKSNEPK